MIHHYRCAECGSPDVHVTAWITLNGERLLPCDGPIDTIYCNDCDEGDAYVVGCGFPFEQLVLVAPEPERPNAADIAEAAAQEFWAKVVELVPDATTGDMDPGSSVAIDEAMREAVAVRNLPDLIRRFRQQFGAE